MKFFVQFENKFRTFDTAGMNNNFIVSDLKTLRGLVNRLKKNFSRKGSFRISCNKTNKVLYIN